METLSQTNVETEFGIYPNELSPFEIQDILEYSKMEDAEDSFYIKGEPIL